MIFGPEYHKIQTVFKRTERGIIIEDQFTTEEIAYLAPLKWRWTEKIDGTNIRLHFDGDSITVGGRTDNAQIPGGLIFALAKFNNPALWREVFCGDINGVGCESPPDVTIYGEGYGAGIQKGGGLYRQDKGFIVFDMRIGSFWLKPAAVAEIATKLGMDTVPVIDEMELTEAIRRVKMASWNPTTLRSAFPGVKPEGIVGTPLARLYDARGERVVVKLKLADFEALQKNLDRTVERTRVVERDGDWS
jgi:hypothetical protein